MAALSEETGYTPTQETLSDAGRGPHSQGIQSSVFKPHHHLFSMKHASLSLTVSASGSKGDQGRSKSIFATAGRWLHLRVKQEHTFSIDDDTTYATKIEIEEIENILFVCLIKDICTIWTPHIPV